MHLNRSISSTDLGLIGGPQIDPESPAGCGNLRRERASGDGVGRTQGVHVIIVHNFFAFLLFCQCLAAADKTDATAQNFILSAGLYGLEEGGYKHKEGGKNKRKHGGLAHSAAGSLFSPPLSPFSFRRHDLFGLLSINQWRMCLNELEVYLKGASS